MYVLDRQPPSLLTVFYCTFPPLTFRLLLCELSLVCFTIDYLDCDCDCDCIMGATVLGKRSRNPGQDSQEQLPPAKYTRRQTRSFREGNDENHDPTTTIDAGNESQDEEVAIFSPAATRTPSARRTRTLSKVEAIDCRESCAPQLPCQGCLTLY